MYSGKFICIEDAAIDYGIPKSTLIKMARSGYLDESKDFWGA